MKNCKISSSVSLASILLVMFCLVGCDAGKPRNPAPVAKDPPVVADEPAQPQPQAEPERELVDIGRNVTGKADFAEGGDRHIMAPILVPLGEYFNIRERTVFNMQIPHAMNLYMAEHDRAPASHEEFMEKIIRANHINLPALRNPDDKYRYDPASGELKISTTKR